MADLEGMEARVIARAGKESGDVASSANAAEGAVGLVEVVEGNWPLSGGDGAYLDPLYSDPIVKANKPTGGYRKHGFDTFHLSRYDNTDLVQWFGRRIDGCFHPWGQLMRITPAGKAALVKFRAGRPDPTDTSRSPI